MALQCRRVDGLAVNTIRRAEKSAAGLSIHPNNEQTFLEALTEAGIHFIDGSYDLGPGRIARLPAKKVGVTAT